MATIVRGMTSGRLAAPVRVLERDPSSRRAVLYLGRTENDQEMECLTTVQFLVRGRHLHVFVYVRSLDVRRKLPRDAVAVAHAAARLVRALDLRASTLRFYAASAHVYI